MLFQVKNFTFCIEFNYTLIHRQVVSDSCNCMDCRPTRLLSPSHFPRRNTGVRCHFLLQGIFPNQRLNSDLLHSGGSPALQADSLMTEPPGKLIHSLNSIYIYVNGHLPIQPTPQQSFLKIQAMYRCWHGKRVRLYSKWQWVSWRGPYTVWTPLYKKIYHM